MGILPAMRINRLSNRPQWRRRAGLLHAAEDFEAKTLSASRRVRTLETSPVHGELLRVGRQAVGKGCHRGPLSDRYALHG
jgi:hypothetical protein